MDLSGYLHERFDPGLPAFVTVARGSVRLFLSEHTGDARPDETIHASHQELADMVAAYRETVTLTLDEFLRQGMVDLGRCSIELLDRRALEAIA